MMGSVFRNETDLALGVLVSSERRNVVDFSNPILFINYRVFLRRPSNLTIDWDDFLTPFSGTLWITTFFCCFVLSLEMSTLYWLGRRHGNIEEDGPSLYNFSESFLCVFGAMFCQQGHPSSPSSSACRIVFLVVFAVGVVLLSAYSADLISSLATQRVVLPFHSLDELVQDGSYRLGVRAGSALIGMFKLSGGTLREVYDRYLASSPGSLPADYRTGFNMVCEDEKYALLIPYEVSYEYSRTAGCPVSILPKTFTTGTMSNAFQRNSPYLGIINHIIHKLRSGGVLKCIRKRAWTFLPNEDESVLTAVGLVKVLPILSMLLLGAVASIVVLGIELLICRWQHRHQLAYREEQTDQTLFLSNNSIKSSCQNLRVKRQVKISLQLY